MKQSSSAFTFGHYHSSDAGDSRRFVSKLLKYCALCIILDAISFCEAGDS